MSSLIRAVCLLLLWSSSLTTVAHAQPPSGGEQDVAEEKAGAREDAEQLLKRANEHFRAGEYRAAAAGYQRLLDLLGEEAGWFAHLNLALTYEAAVKPTEAAAHYEAFLEAAASKDLSEDNLQARVDKASQRLAGIRSRYGKLHIAAGREVVLVRVGTRDARPAGFSLYLAPGIHQVEIDHGTDRSRIEAIDIVAGETAELRADRRAKRHPAPTPPPVAPDGGASFPTVVVATLSALAVASVALPIGLNVFVNDLRDDAAALGTDHVDYPEARDDFNAARIGYYVSFALPAALAASAVGVVIAHAVDDDVTLSTDGSALWMTARF